MLFEIFHFNKSYQDRFECLHSHHLEMIENNIEFTDTIVSGIYRTIEGVSVDMIKSRLRFDYENTGDCFGYEIIEE